MQVDTVNSSIFGIFLFLLLGFSCQSTESQKKGSSTSDSQQQLVQKVEGGYVLAKVDAFDYYEENETLVRDLISYDLERQTVLALGLKPVALADVLVKPYRMNGEKASFIHLKFPRSSEHEEEVANHLSKIYNAKYYHHLRRLDQLDEVQKLAEKFVGLIRQEKIEEIWSLSGDKLKSMIDQEDLLRVFQDRNKKALKTWEHKLNHRQLQNELDGMRGDYIVISYKVGKFAREQFVFEKNRKGWSLVGYHYQPNHNRRIRPQ